MVIDTYPQCLIAIHTAFPSSLSGIIIQILDLSLRSLQSLFPLFKEFYLLSDEGLPSAGENEPPSLLQLAATIFDFITSCSRGSRARDWFNNADNINLSVETISSWAQITQDEVRKVYPLFPSWLTFI